MITNLLWLLAIAAVSTVIFVIGRLIFDIVRLFIERRRGRDDASLPPLWRDVKAVGIAAQIAAIVIIGGLAAYLWSNFRSRTDDIGLELTFDFLDQPGGISIADHPLTPADQIGEAITAGFYNTIRIIIVGIPLALVPPTWAVPACSAL